jgi:8-oxo-dGTP pyrophosphatase MutT (NUDIX family)
MSPRTGPFYPWSAALTAADPRGTTGAVSDSPARPPTPREAASIILARDVPAGLEVLLLQRHPKSRFSPGAFAFPGGRLEAADAAPGVAARCRGLGRIEAARQLRDVQPPERAIGFWVTALRELFEEAGMLLAYGPDARPVSAVSIEDVRAHRTRCREDSAAFGRLLVERNLTLATDRVGYWAHWITPEERPIRYDTRFFVAAAWADQVAEPDGLEMVAARWIRPDDALARHEARELVLPLPTQRILASLSQHANVDAILAATGGRDIRSIRPRIIRDASGERVLLPEDPDWF